ncbi:hypothetical protein E2493_02285 [Sphingomonas parva]|uniref:Uncharacterized protein n=1 Tax=Sphingomonas parva TaxID=2555898 RepID=A0A4Y8ZXW0_9SPHN|nr:hypothetical protein [Sphingomonas parva]TFI60095.1 hypothetical protein E2493_02285 [Sphingomonas parva]
MGAPRRQAAAQPACAEPARSSRAARKSPFAALLILLGLMLAGGPGTVPAAGDPLARPNALRQGGPARSLLRSDQGNRLWTDAAPADADSLGPPPSPNIVVERLATRPGQLFTPGAFAGLPGRAAAPYRARAPPAG